MSFKSKIIQIKMARYFINLASDKNFHTILYQKKLSVSDFIFNVLTADLNVYEF
ncbi:36525_t:CDS:2 [Gigaspora margarita]|uniref:36525_t:CDS:1 n=1 Tax=Gigaspora margarita TaxID=4874 RepID=A0ABN7UY18_GIGMA|nr:36525_t:CDS:2 [Gigaspora margarita]